MSSFHSSPLLSAEGICKTYKTRTVVDQVSLKVGHGEIVGLLGPNGAGKTTAVGVLATLLRPDSGHARVAGFDVDPNEVAGVRHPVFGGRGTKRPHAPWVTNQHRPFLAPAADQSGDAAAEKFAQVIDDWAIKAGFR